MAEDKKKTSLQRSHVRFPSDPNLLATQFEGDESEQFDSINPTSSLSDSTTSLTPAIDPAVCLVLLS
jgi:hypothetical protein